MADKKISALTAATLPLAGTEVLPIVQSGSTVKVATDDLTVKNVRSNATSGLLQIVGPGAGATRVMTTPNANFTAARTDAAQSFTGDQTLGTGDLIQGTAAKGFNFTANTPAAGMTSQLLNWYEEGSFTATAVPDTGTITLSTATLRYTRVGRMVNISGILVVGSVSSPTNNVYVATLPFSAGLACGGGIAIDGTNAFAGQVGWFINAGQQSLYIYYRDATGAYVASAAIFKAGTVIRIDATYTV